MSNLLWLTGYFNSPDGGIRAVNPVNGSVVDSFDLPGYPDLFGIDRNGTRTYVVNADFLGGGGVLLMLNGHQITTVVDLTFTGNVPLSCRMSPAADAVYVGLFGIGSGARLVKTSLDGTVLDSWRPSAATGRGCDSIAFNPLDSPDVIYYTSSDSIVRRFDTASGTQLSDWIDLSTVSGGTRTSWGLDFAPDGTAAVTFKRVGAADGVVIIYPDLSTLVLDLFAPPDLGGNVFACAVDAVAAYLPPPRIDTDFNAIPRGPALDVERVRLSDGAASTPFLAPPTNFTTRYVNGARIGPPLGVPWLRQKQRDDVERVYFPSGTRGGIPTSGQKSQRQGIHGTYW